MKASVYLWAAVYLSAALLLSCGTRETEGTPNAARTSSRHPGVTTSHIRSTLPVPGQGDEDKGAAGDAAAVAARVNEIRALLTEGSVLPPERSNSQHAMIDPMEWARMGSDGEKLKWAQRVFFSEGPDVVMPALVFLTNSLDHAVRVRALGLIARAAVRARDFEQADHYYQQAEQSLAIVDAGDRLRIARGLDRADFTALRYLWLDRSICAREAGRTANDADEVYWRQLILHALQERHVHRTEIADAQAWLAFALARRGQMEAAIHELTDALQHLDDNSTFMYRDTLDNWKKGHRDAPVEML